MFTNLKIRIAATALALLPSLAFASEAAQQQRPAQQSAQHKFKLPAGLRVVSGLRPDKPQKVSNDKPAIQRLKARAVSWQVVNDSEQQRHSHPHWNGSTRVDPYQITVEGLNKGSKVTVTKKGALQAIAMPDVERLALRDEQGRKIDSAKFRKIINRDYNKQLARAVATARPDEALIGATHAGESSAQPLVIDSPSSLPTNSTLTISAVDPFGRKYQSKEITVDGRDYTDSGWSQWRWADQRQSLTQRDRQQTGGRFQASEGAQILKANLRSTPVLERIVDKGYQKVDGKWQRVKEKQTFVKLLGLAAFSPNATVTITNKRMEALGLGAAAVVTFKSNGKGAGAIEVPALLGDELRIHVQTRQGAEIQGSATSMDIKIPSATKDSKFMHDRYLAID